MLHVSLQRLKEYCRSIGYRRDFVTWVIPEQDEATMRERINF